MMEWESADFSVSSIRQLCNGVMEEFDFLLLLLIGIGKVFNRNDELCEDCFSIPGRWIGFMND